MVSTSEDQRKSILIEIKLLSPSFKIKFIQVYKKEVKSAILIEIQARRSSFKYKLEIESDELFICSSRNKYTDIVPIFLYKYKN